MRIMDSDSLTKRRMDLLTMQIFLKCGGMCTKFDTGIIRDLVRVINTSTYCTVVESKLTEQGGILKHVTESYHSYVKHDKS